MVGRGIMNPLVFRNTYCSESDVATREVAGTLAWIWAAPLSALVIIGPHGRKSNDMERGSLACFLRLGFCLRIHCDGIGSRKKRIFQTISSFERGKDAIHLSDLAISDGSQLLAGQVANRSWCQHFFESTSHVWSLAILLGPHHRDRGAWFHYHRSSCAQAG